VEFVRLILAHLIGDFVLQPKSWVDEKEKAGLRSPKIYLHSLIHGVLVLLVLWNLSYWLLALTLAIIHLVIDLAKQRFQKENNKSRWFLIDQSLHIVIIFALWILFFGPNLSLTSIFENNLFWIYLTAVLFLTVACGIAIQIILENWTRFINFSKAESLPNAGKYIGILERLLVFTFVVLGHWEAIGFLVAAKSVFRFGDLKDSGNRKLTEYILIGTLLSFGIAIVIGIIVVSITAQLK
jgi:magnesium-transporting ATPase (P-type)